MKRSFYKIFKGLLAMTLLVGTARADHLSDELLVVAQLNGAQEVPSVNTEAMGVAALTFNSTWDSLFVNISVNGLSGPVTGIHVHEGMTGSNGGVVTNLTSFVQGNRIVGVLTGSNLTKQNIAGYLSGQYYVNVHTKDNPNGEIRGQLMLETDWGFRAALDTAQETAPVSNDARGLGYFNLSRDGSKLEVRVQTEMLSGSITGAHLHWGRKDVDGGVALSLTSMISGSTIMGEADISSVNGLMDSLVAGAIYINVHTSANPAGEIRGQLSLDRGLAFDSWLNTDQEVTSPTGSNGMGAAWISINPTIDTLWYEVQANGMSGTITGAHIHNAAPGVDGGVIVNLSSNINGNRISGMITGSAITADLLEGLLIGETYFNLHTSMNPAGEIRGQIYRLAREGYTFSMSSQNEVPTAFSQAQGSGIVSIDRDQTNLHYMIVINDLSGAITGAHFHKAVKGSNGGVIYNLTSSFDGNGTDDYAGGFWKSTDANSFTKANALQFRRDSIYVNIHTANKPSGEIRGQVMRGARMATVLNRDNGMRPMDPNFEGNILFSARMNGAQEVPAVTTNASGVAAFKLNTTRDTLWTIITSGGLSGAITGIHIHEGQAGSNGNVVTNLTDMVDGNQVKGYITDFDLNKFITGMYYVNLHTAMNPNGEIRGQIKLEGAKTYMADLSGSNEVPMVTTDAFGLGVFNLTADEKALEIRVVTSGLSGNITGAHLHKGAKGANGGVILNLGSFIKGNSVTAVVDPSAFLADLKNGMIYLNVHTQSNPGGEIRAQLELMNGFVTDAWLNGAQEEPATMVNGKGVSAMWFSPMWDTLYYDVVVDELTGPITGAHIHNAEVGANGGVDVNLSANISGNRIKGSASGSALSAVVIDRILGGTSYVNIHTDANPSGEIRGQVYRLAADGYAYDMCGDQEEPAIQTMADGSGVLSIDRWNKMHTMYSTSGLSGAITSTHLHEGAIGQNGGVLYDLGSGIMNNSSYTFTDISSENAAKVKSGGTYVNVHTAMNAGGEIRGQVNNASENCETATSSLATVEVDLFSVYPNPMSDKVQIEGLDESKSYRVRLIDMTGKVAFDQNFSDNKVIINTDEYSVGIYQLIIEGENYSQTTKLIKR